MAKLSAAERDDLPNSAFAGPGRTYPIHDQSHAENAISQVAKSGDPKLMRRVRMAVALKYPDIKIQGLQKD